jgi:hypothetical protein
MDIAQTRRELALALTEVLSADECERIGRNLSRPALLRKVWDDHLGRLPRGNAATGQEQ